MARGTRLFKSAISISYVVVILIGVVTKTESRVSNLRNFKMLEEVSFRREQKTHIGEG